MNGIVVRNSGDYNGVGVLFDNKVTPFSGHYFTNRCIELLKQRKHLATCDMEEYKLVLLEKLVRWDDDCL
jgi:hypothetical protein